MLRVEKRCFWLKNDSQVVKNAFSWGLQKLCDSMHRIYLLFCFGQIIRNLDRIRYLVKRRCNFFEYSISSPTKRVFYPNWTLPKRCSFFLCKITNITSRICTQRIFAPKFMLMARNRRWTPLGVRIRRLQTALTSSSAALHACTQSARRLRPDRTHQPAHNR